MQYHDLISHSSTYNLSYHLQPKAYSAGKDAKCNLDAYHIKHWDWKLSKRLDMNSISTWLFWEDFITYSHHNSFRSYLFLLVRAGKANHMFKVVKFRLPLLSQIQNGSKVRTQFIVFTYIYLHFPCINILNAQRGKRISTGRMWTGSMSLHFTAAGVPLAARRIWILPMNHHVSRLITFEMK
jgi:hypothetical protein